MMKQGPLRNISWFIASVGGAGYLPKMPGTWGSIVGLLTFSFLPLEIMLFFTVLGYGATFIILKGIQDSDPKEIVIDEVVGIWLAFWVCSRPMLWPEAFGVFLTFRIFDIIKPFPIGWVDLKLSQSKKFKALGVMLDDIIAGLIAGLIWCAWP